MGHKSGLKVLSKYVTVDLLSTCKSSASQSIRVSYEGRRAHLIRVALSGDLGRCFDVLHVEAQTLEEDAISVLCVVDSAPHQPRPTHHRT